MPDHLLDLHRHRGGCRHGGERVKSLEKAIIAVTLGCMGGYLAGVLYERADPSHAKTSEFANGVGVTIGVTLMILAFAIVLISIKDDKDE